VYHRDGRGREGDAGVEGGQRQVVPVGDLPEEDLGEVPVEVVLVLVQAARVSRMIAAADQMTGWMVRRG
jgi:hypothetical protein